MNILYIGEPHSIHDIKWMSFFASRPGYNVYLLSEHHKLDDPEKDTESLERMNIRFLGIMSSFSIRKGLKTWRSVRTIRRAIREHDIHFVHFLFTTPYSLWGLFIQVPYIITTRGSDVLVVLPYLLRSGAECDMRNRILYSLFGKAFRKAAAITSTSLAQVSKIKELFVDVPPALLVRTGVPVEAISRANPREGLPAGKLLIFSPRYFSPVYGIELQLEAIEHLPADRIGRMHFVFIKGASNDTAYALELQSRLQALHDEKGLTYEVLEEISQAGMFSIYKAAALTLLTPRSDGTPNSALEAMAAGCPLIVPNLPYDRQLFNDGTCHFLKERDPKILADLILRVLDGDVSRVTAEAMETVSRYGNRDIEMGRLEGLYHDLYRRYYAGKSNRE